MEKQPLVKHGWLRVLLFLICFLLIILLFLQASGMILNALNIRESETSKVSDPQDIMKERFLLIKFLVSILASIVTVVIFRKLVDKRSLTSLGLTWRNNESHAGTGFFLALLLLGIGTFVLIANKNLRWIDITFDPDQLFISLGFLVLIAFAEELVFRGYVLNNLMQSTNKWIALAISALLFALFHGQNPGTTTIALINIFLGGLVLGINYIYTKNLWYSISFHISWNFFEGSILGYKVSGLSLQSLLQQELSGDPLLTGGDFGFEASVLDGALSVITVLTLAWIYEKKFSMKPNLVS